MSSMEASEPGSGATRFVVLALWTLAATAAPFAPAVASGLLLVGLGALVLALLPAGRLRTALESRSAWECAARASGTTGAVAAIVLYARALGSSEGGIEAIATGMALGFVLGVAGLAFASLAVAIAFRLPPPADPPAAAPAAGAWNARLARALYLGLVGWAVLAPRLGQREPRFEPWQLLLHWPALLVLAGATLVLLLLFGRRWRDLMPVAIAAAGTLAALVGLGQALLGMAQVSIAQVTAGLESLTTACFVALVALALLAVPQARAGDARARTATNVAYALFPLVSLLLLAVAVVMVLTPMKQPA